MADFAVPLRSEHFQWMTTCFFVTYIIAVHLVLLNAAVAVLLEVCGHACLRALKMTIS
jgi:hypothetical protein